MALILRHQFTPRPWPRMRGSVRPQRQLGRNFCDAAISLGDRQAASIFFPEDPATQLRNGPQTATGQNVRILVRRCASPRSRISLVIFPSWIVQQHAQQALSRRERSRHSGGSLGGLGGSLGGLWRCTVDNEGNEGPRADADIRTVRRSTEACFFLRHQLVEFRLNALIIPSLSW